MILGVGIDLADAARVGRVRARWGERFLEKVFTPGELEGCLARRDVDHALAARFAAKEAGMKALGTGWGAGVDWCDLEVVASRGASPVLRLSGGAAEVAARLGVVRTHLSLTHDGGMAAAVVVLEGP